MHPLLAGTLALSLARAGASIVARQEFSAGSDENPIYAHFIKVCLPTNSSGYPDLDAPCVINDLITLQCTYGITDIFSDNSDNSTYGPDGERNRTSPASQQLCICGSQYFNSLFGCLECAEKHGVGAAVPSIASSRISTFSSSYCAASYSPTTDAEIYYFNAFSSDYNNAIPRQTSTAYTDPIGNKTDVSLYYTAAVTGSAAYVVSPSLSGSSGIVTSNGQIVATAAQATGAGTTSRSSGLAALITPCAEKYAIAGVIGLAGAVAML